MRRIRLRYKATCATCNTELAVSTYAWWDTTAKTATCERCHDSAEASKSTLERGTAGGSAQREHDRRKAERERNIQEAHPRLGRLILALTDDPQTTTAWAKGAAGERRLGTQLDDLEAAGALALHDRRIPRSRGNIDHLVIAPSGIFVIDTKQYRGQVKKRDVGGLFRRDDRVFVGRRDCTRLVEAMPKQVTAVRDAAGELLGDLPVIPALCFVAAEWRLFARPFVVREVWVGWPRALGALIRQPGPLTPTEIDMLGRQIVARLPAA